MLNVVVLGTVVDDDVLGRTLATLTTETLLTVELEAAVEVVEEIAIAIDEGVTLVVLETTLLPPTMPPRIVESRDCVVVVLLLLVLTLTLCAVVLRLTTAKTVDCIELVEEITIAVDEGVGLAVLDTAPALPRSPTTVESSG